MIKKDKKNREEPSKIILKMIEKNPLITEEVTRRIKELKRNAKAKGLSIITDRKSIKETIIIEIIIELVRQKGYEIY